MNENDEFSDDELDDLEDEGEEDERDVTEDDTDDQPELITPADREQAMQLLRSPHLLFEVAAVMKGLRIAGERENGLLIYLVGTSRLLEQPLSVIPKGESAAGKSYLVTNMLRLFPKNAYRDITFATAKSFYHVERDYFKHRIIVVFERHGTEQTDYAVRTFQSEKKLILQITVRDKKSDTGWSVKKKVVDGPVGFVTTTTSAQIHAENETRCLSLFIDDGEAQTREILKMIDSKYLGVHEATDDDLKHFRVAQCLLEPLPVCIPFVDVLSDFLPTKVLRIRRDYSKILSCIEASALLHQFQRERKMIDGKEHLVANLCDYHIAQIVTRKLIANTIFELPPKSIQLIELAKSLDTDQESLDGTFTVKTLAMATGWNYDTTLKWFAPARDKGYFEEVEAQRGRYAAIYKVTSDKKIDAIQEILPSVSQLVREHPTVYKGEAVYNPLTGESVSLGQ